MVNARGHGTLASPLWMTSGHGRWTYAAALAGFVANGLFVAFYAGFAAQGFDGPSGVAAALGTASDAAGVSQNALLVPVALVVYGFLSIDVAPIAWIGLVLGALAWLAIPFWVLALGRSLNPDRRVKQPTPAAEWSSGAA
jgi:hypothetical protein